MTLPACNPIDYGWFAKGAAIDHISTIDFNCKVCDSSTKHEKFLILVGSQVGFGVPFFAAPFVKHTSTKGKLGGKRGHVAQCRQCNSLWAIDQGGIDALAKAGLPAELIALEHANEYRNRVAKAIEDSGLASEEPQRPSSPSRRIQKSHE